MKHLLSIYTNWRNDVLMAIFAASLFLLFGEAENWVLLALTKILGGFGFAAFVLLYRHWDSCGKIKELSDLAKEEE